MINNKFLCLNPWKIKTKNVSKLWSINKDYGYGGGFDGGFGGNGYGSGGGAGGRGAGGPRGGPKGMPQHMAVKINK